MLSERLVPVDTILIVSPVGNRDTIQQDGREVFSRKEGSNHDLRELVPKSEFVVHNVCRIGGQI